MSCGFRPALPLTGDSDPGGLCPGGLCPPMSQSICIAWSCVKYLQLWSNCAGFQSIANHHTSTATANDVAAAAGQTVTCHHTRWWLYCRHDASQHDVVAAGQHSQSLQHTAPHHSPTLSNSNPGHKATEQKAKTMQISVECEEHDVLIVIWSGRLIWKVFY